MKPYETITVQDIIDRADVSRSTFYAHYVDKDNLLLDAFRGLRERSTARAEPGVDRGGLFSWSLELFSGSPTRPTTSAGRRTRSAAS